LKLRVSLRPRGGELAQGELYVAEAVSAICGSLTIDAPTELWPARRMSESSKLAAGSGDPPLQIGRWMERERGVIDGCPLGSRGRASGRVFDESVTVGWSSGRGADKELR
jgi:hypothetical protein